MPNTVFNSKTPSLFRFLSSLLIFALASPPLGYAQQPQQPQTPQQRILLEEDQKTNAAKQSGPRAARPELVLQTGITAPALNIAFSPDGRLLASMDGLASSIKLWEVSTGRELHAINLGARSMYTIAFSSPFVFSPDGSSLFSVSGGTLKQWDTRTGRQLRSADLNSGKDFSQTYFSADARLLAVSSEIKSSIALWDAGSGRKLQDLKLDSNNVEKLLASALSPDGRTLATDTESRSRSETRDMLTLRDATSGRVIQTIKISEQKSMAQAMSGISTEAARAIRFSPDGRAVAVAFHDETQDVSQVLSGGQARVTGRANRIRIWDVSSGRELISLDSSDAQSASAIDQTWIFRMPNTFAFSNDNRQCAVVSGRTIKLFDPATGRNMATMSGHNGEVVAVSFSADGKLLATTSLDSTIKIWDVSLAVIGRVELERTLSGMAMPVDSAAFNGDGRGLAVSGANAVSVWELNTGAALRTIIMPAVTRGVDDLTRPSRTVFGAGGQLIAAKSGANEVKLWETRSGREVKSFPITQGKTFAGGAISPDGKWVALAEDRPDSRPGFGAANPPGDTSAADQPQAPQSAQNFPQTPSVN